MSDTHIQSRYSAVAIALHWVIALGILGLIAVGWIMGDMEEGPQQEALYQMHKSFGITVLLLTVARILWRIMNPPPPLPEEMKPIEKTASHTVHIAFYVLMILMPLTGWMYVSTAYNFDIPTVLFGVVSWPDLPLGFLSNETANGVIMNVHSKLAWVAIGLLVLHVAGAIKHEFDAGDGVLKRMIPGLFGRTDKPVPPPRGFIMAFGVSIALFLAIAAIPIASQGPRPVLESGAPATGSSAWIVNKDNSAIEFSGTNSGEAFSGRFRTWNADITFNPDDLAASQAVVTIDMTSVDTGSQRYNDTLKTSEWFALRDFPTATVTVDNITQTDSGYTSTATIEMKGASAEFPFDFTLDIDGDTATMNGSSVLTRGALNLGQQSDPSGDWVSDEIRVDVSVAASRAE